MGKLNWGKRAYAAFLLCAATAIALPAQTFTTLHSYDGADGNRPFARLLQATDGNLYGATAFGGGNDTCTGFSAGCGTVFKITPSGALTTLHSFDRRDGARPFAGLIQAADGNFYGTTNLGGGHGGGTVFKITPSGTLTTLYRFCSLSGCTDGAGPSRLVQATDGNFYGTTSLPFGTVFKITSSGTLTTLHSFCLSLRCTDGAEPTALVQAADGKFYGTTLTGGGGGSGTVFKITPSGTLTTLYSFNGGDDRAAALVQDTNGQFYGTAPLGGSGACTNGCGTVFSLSLWGLGPFVETLPAAGKVGAIIKILGTSLTGATGVTLNGTRAVFHVISSSLITATVPLGATTGPIKVVVPSGTLSSNVPFRVLP